MDAKREASTHPHWKLHTVRHLNRTSPFDTETAIRFVRELGETKTDEDSKETGEGDVYQERFCGEEARQFYESVINSDAVNDSCIKVKGPKKHPKPSHIRLKRKAKPDNSDRVASTSTLFKLAQDGDLRRLSFELSKGLHGINMTDQFDWTLLMTAATAGHMTTVQYLLDNGARWVGLTDKAQMDAVSLARRSGHHDIADYLIGRHKQDHHQPLEPAEQVTETSTSKPEGVCESRDTNGKLVKLVSETGTSSNSTDQSQESFHCDICQQMIRDTPTSLHSVSISHQFSCQHKTPMLPYGLTQDTPTSLHSVSISHQFACQHKTPMLPYGLTQTNKGFQMMLKNGWDPEQGLGSKGQGRKFPVKTVLKRDRSGVGGGGSSDVPRVTHYRPGDTSAIMGYRSGRGRGRGNIEGEKRPMNKKEREKAIRKERRWEIGIRRYMSSMDDENY